MSADPHSRTTVLVTGGAGFIGSAVVRHLLAQPDVTVVNLDALTYAANPMTVDELDRSDRHHFVHADIRDSAALTDAFRTHRPDLVIHLAAESHVDRSIDRPAAFLETNVDGTYRLLEAATRHWSDLGEGPRERFRFVHVSTDEVYGALGPDGVFTEDSPYRPNSPYAATKAASDHLARAWWTTFGLPTIVTNASNNYGPYQFPEKLIPRAITRALHGESIEVYGRGENVRDWLHVNDHAAALWRVATTGRPGETYNVGSTNELSNIDLVRRLCRALDAVVPEKAPHEDLIVFVKDRPGHDFRYAIDNAKIARELDWRPVLGFEEGLHETMRWYLENRDWWGAIRDNSYRGERLGLTSACEAD